MTFAEFKNEFEKKAVEVYPNSVNDRPLVSVSVTTYQHEKFIAHCLESLVNQQTDFDYEILVGEDVSSDNSRKICIEYAKKYPDKIRLFLHHKENKIKVNGKLSGRFNCLYNYFSAKGEYFAQCDGDDFWIDPKKLQKQVDALKANSDWSACFGIAKLVDENGTPTGGRAYPQKNLKQSYNLNEGILERNVANSPTYIFRKTAVGDPPRWILKTPGAFWGFCVLSGKIGRIGFLNQELAAYRIHPNSTHSSQTTSAKLLLSIKGRMIIKPFLSKEYHESLEKGIKNYSKKIIKDSLKNNKIEDLKNLKNFIFRERGIRSYAYQRISVVLLLRRFSFPTKLLLKMI